MLSVMSLHALRVTRKESFHEEVYFTNASREIVVSIEGAVAQPGRYHFKKGTTLMEALKQAKLLPEADLSRFKVDTPIKRSRKIKVPCKKQKRKKAPVSIDCKT